MLAGKVNSALSAESWDLIKTEQAREKQRNAWKAESREGQTEGHKDAWARKL